MTDPPPPGDAPGAADPYAAGGGPYGPGPGYGAAPFGAPPYGAPPPGPYGYGYGYGPPQYEHPQGTTILVLGILGIVACQVLGPVAWVLGNRAMEEIDQNPTAYSNRGLVVAGRICGIVASVLLGIYVAMVGIYFVIIAAAIGSGA